MKKPRLKQSRLTAKTEFKWSDMDVWEPRMRELMADVLDDRVFAAFHDDPPEFVVGDDLSWLDKIIRAVCGTWSDKVLDLLTEQIPENYRFVIGFHACRPITLDDYRRIALPLSDPHELNRRSRELSCGNRHDEAAI